MWFARCVTVSSPRMLFHMGMILQPQRRRLYHAIFRPPGCSVLKHMLHVGRAEFCDVSKLCNTSGPLDYTFLRLGCTFSTFQFPKMPRIWCHATQRDVCSSLIRPDGSAPTALASLLLEPSEPQNNGKKIVLRDFSIFSRACIFFLLFSGSSRLCFFLCPCCREFDF